MFFDLISRFQYLAMFGILILCGLGLPVPEEVTLILSGVLVGLEKANFWLATLACTFGILLGDSFIFGMGYYFGKNFLRSRPMRFLLPPRRQKKVARFFAKHDNKAVFLARFVAGVRLGVYAYAGSQRMSWGRFLLLDSLGAMLSVPTSIWVGKWATTKFILSRDVPFDELSQDEKEQRINETFEAANQMIHDAGVWILLGVGVLLVVYVAFKLIRRRRRPDSQAEPLADSKADAEPYSGPVEESAEAAPTDATS